MSRLSNLHLPASSDPLSSLSNLAGKTLMLYKLTVQAAVRPLWQMMWKLPSCCCCRLPGCPMLLPLPLLLLLLPLPQVQLEQFHNSLTIINASSVERQTALASQKFGAPIQGSPQAKPSQGRGRGRANKQLPETTPTPSQLLLPLPTGTAASLNHKLPARCLLYEMENAPQMKNNAK